MLDDRLERHLPAAAATLVAIVTSASLVLGQTKIVAPDNKYTPSDDVKLGREAAQEVQQQLPLLRDDGVDDYVETVGQRLVNSIPSEFRHSEFRYTFEVVNVSDINAFALPGGPMFVNRGMIEAARNEGEVAGVLAHEISHVALRHGTAQASKATKYEVGSVIGQIAGAILGGTAGPGGVARQPVRLRHRVPAIQPRVRTAGRSSRRADHGARRLRPPRHGQHVRDDSVESSGNGGPEWLSSHPNPSNRQQTITQEAAKLTVSNPIRNTQRFTQVKTRLAAHVACAVD